MGRSCTVERTALLAADIAAVIGGSLASADETFPYPGRYGLLLL